MKNENFEIFLTILRFLGYKITNNLKKIYCDIEGDKVLLTVFYETEPSELELELLDDIETNSDAHLPNHYVDSKIKLFSEYDENEKHDYLIFATYDS